MLGSDPSGSTSSLVRVELRSTSDIHFCFCSGCFSGIPVSISLLAALNTAWSDFSQKHFNSLDYYVLQMTVIFDPSQVRTNTSEMQARAVGEKRTLGAFNRLARSRGQHFGGYTKSLSISKSYRVLVSL